MASTNQELQAQLDQANTEADELAAENDRLRAALEEAKAEPANSTSYKDRQPKEPSFQLTEGNREELARLGHTISPFTGARLVGDVADGKVSNVREVDQATFDKVAKDAKDKANAVDFNKGTTFPKADSTK